MVLETVTLAGVPSQCPGVSAGCGMVLLSLTFGAAPAAAPDVRARPVWTIRDDVRGIPVVAAGAVYALTRDHRVLAADAATGVVRWKERTERHGRPARASTLAVAGGVVVAGDEGVTGLDQESGRMRWRLSPPAGSAIGVYVGGATSDLILTGSGVGRVFAVRASTGELAWSTSVASEPATVFWPVIEDGLVFAGYTAFRTENAGGVGAVDARTGRLLWRASFPRASRAVVGMGWAGGPLVAGGIVVAASGDGRIHGFSRRNGSRVWSIDPIAAPGAAGPPLGDFRALGRSGRRLIAGSTTGVLSAYDLASQEELWRFAAPRSGSIGFGLGSGGATVYVPYGDGSLAAVRVDDGRVRWQSERRGFLWPPAVSESLVYAVSSTEGLCAFRR